MQPDTTAARNTGWLRASAIVLALIAASALVAVVINSVLADAGKPRKATVQTIAVLRPPPPPPPPKPEQKPPEPEIKPQEVKIPEPQQQPDEAKPDDAPPAGDKLGLDADGSAGSDGFGLAARKGGRDLLTIGKGGAGGSEYAWFGGRLQRHLQDELARLKELQGADYRVAVRIWVNREGRIHRAELVGTTGNAETDRAIQNALLRVPALAEAPPETMPQPVRLRISSRAAG